jgi:hypothetical protein
MKMLVFIFCIFYALFGFAQTNKTNVKTVLENMKLQETFWNNGDIPGFMQYYWKHDSLKFIGSKGITYGWQSTLDNYLKAYPNKGAMGTLTFNIVESVALSKTSIYVIGKWHLQKEKAVGGYFTLLWKKINNKWVIVADHTS